MDIFLAALFGFIVALVAAYFLYVKNVLAELEALKALSGGTGVRFAAIIKKIEAAWYAAFGPVGMPDSAQDQAFNDLWDEINKDQNGMPRG